MKTASTNRSKAPIDEPLKMRLQFGEQPRRNVGFSTAKQCLDNFSTKTIINGAEKTALGREVARACAHSVTTAVLLVLDDQVRKRADGRRPQTVGWA